MAASMRPTQIGAVLKPTKAEMIKLDREYQDVTPADDMYHTLPCTMLNNREWSLPDSQEHLIHTHRYVQDGRHQNKIKGTLAYWREQPPVPVAGGLGEKIGEETSMTLMFSVRGGQDIMGIWKAREYRSLENDGTSAMVTLVCTDADLVNLEKQIKEKESQLWDLRQERLEHEHCHSYDLVHEMELKINRMVRKISNLKLLLEQRKDFACRTEERNAGVGIGIGLV